MFLYMCVWVCGCVGVWVWSEVIFTTLHFLPNLPMGPISWIAYALWQVIQSTVMQHSSLLCPFTNVVPDSCIIKTFKDLYYSQGNSKSLYWMKLRSVSKYLVAILLKLSKHALKIWGGVFKESYSQRFISSVTYKWAQ